MLKYNNNTINISIIGLGYVGLPLAIEFGKSFDVVGYDIDKKRINNLKKKIDSTHQINIKKFLLSKKLTFTNNRDHISKSNIYIVTVPTPITILKKPDLKHIVDSCNLVGSFINQGDIIIFESTVYPGLTEEICVPILEKKSKLKYNKDFFCGYSPERINPGDNKYNIENIIKITSGSNKKISDFVDKLYKTIIKAGTFKASSIKVAEAAKVIENSQRDINIAFMNELSLIFDKLNIDTNEVLKAANTKWNFLPFTPGLVGGHCIGVDPYYLTFKSKKVGINPQIILSGRLVNDSFPIFIEKKLIKNMNKSSIRILNSRTLIMGLTFKENCSDVRNSKVFDIIDLLYKRKMKIDVYDPLIDQTLINQKKFSFIKKMKTNYYDSIIIAVPHKEFKKIGSKRIIYSAKKNNIIFDIKNIFPNEKKFLKT